MDQLRPSPWHLFHGHLPQPPVWSPYSVLAPRVHSPHGGQSALKNTPKSWRSQISNALCHPITVLTTDHQFLMAFGLCPLPIHVWGPCSEKGACFKLLRPLRSPTPAASAPPHGRPLWPTPLPSSPGSAQSSDLWANCLLKEVSLNPSPRSKVGQFSCFVYTVPHCEILLTAPNKFLIVLFICLSL